MHETRIDCGSVSDLEDLLISNGYKLVYRYRGAQWEEIVYAKGEERVVIVIERGVCRARSTSRLENLVATKR